MSHHHLHRRLARQNNEDQGGPHTITSIVYETMAPTFTGSIAGYITPGLLTTTDDPPPASTPEPQPTSAANDELETTSSAAPPQTSASDRSTSLPASLISPASSVASTVPLFVTSASVTTAPVLMSYTPTGIPTASATANAQTTSDGMTGGAKAGIAIGVILVVGALASLIFFCLRQRQRKAEHQRLEDEKPMATNDIFAASRVGAESRSARTLSTAPRLSLRPVTQFLPGFGGDAQRASRATNLAMAPPRSSPGQSAWERPMTSDGNRANPFGNHAEAVDPVNAAGPAVHGTDADIERAAAGAASAGAAVGLVRGASRRGNAPKPLDFTRTLPDIGPPSPAGTEFSVNEAPGTPIQTSGAAAIAAAGGPQNSAVHRVQLDFKPSMDDELELRAGQLIRLLHEYDDGWALCIRLDRSQQGVVPRTCLSTRPVKPRPQNAPRGNPPPGMRVPQQQQGRPMSPAMNQGQRAASPAQGRPTAQFPPYGSQGRPASPAGNRRSPPGGPRGPPGPPGRPMNQDPRARSNSPAPPRQDRPMNQDPRARSNSPAPPRQDRPNGPPGPSAVRTPYGSPPNGAIGRKPVPGQAM